MKIYKAYYFEGESTDSMVKIYEGADARVGTYMANYIRSGNTLSGAWRGRAMSLAFKYRAQLADIANAKAA
jgi:hypothetical protein